MRCFCWFFTADAAVQAHCTVSACWILACVSFFQNRPKVQEVVIQQDFAELHNKHMNKNLDGWPAAKLILLAWEFCSAASVAGLICIFPLWTCLHWNSFQKEKTNCTKSQTYKGRTFDPFEYWCGVTLKGTYVFLSALLCKEETWLFISVAYSVALVKTSEGDILSTYRSQWNTKVGMKLKMTDPVSQLSDCVLQTWRSYSAIIWLWVLHAEYFCFYMITWGSRCSWPLKLWP